MGRPKKFSNLQPFTVLLDPDSVSLARERLLSSNISLVSVVGTNSGLLRYLLDSVVKGVFKT